MSLDRIFVLHATNVYPDGSNPGRGTFIRSQIESLASVAVDVAVEVAQVHRSKVEYLRLVRRIRRLILRDHRPKLIHAHYGYTGWCAAAALRSVPASCRVPLVVSFLGSDLQFHPAEVPWMRSWVRRAEVSINRGRAHAFDRVIVKSRSMLDVLPDPAHAHVVPNGVDLDLFRPIDRKEARDRVGLRDTPDLQRPFDVLFAGRPEAPVKNFDLASRVVDSLGGRVRLHVVTGRPQEEVVNWMSAADVFLLTSRSEGSPNVVKEALACNLPVVSTDVGDVAELLARSDGGTVVTGRTNDTLVAGLAAGVVKWGEAGRTSARDRIGDLSLQAVASKLRNIYDDVLAGRASGRT